MKRLDETKPTEADGFTKADLLRQIRLLKAAINELASWMESIEKVQLGVGNDQRKAKK